MTGLQIFYTLWAVCTILIYFLSFRHTKKIKDKITIGDILIITGLAALPVIGLIILLITLFFPAFAEKFFGKIIYDASESI